MGDDDINWRLPVMTLAIMVATGISVMCERSKPAIRAEQKPEITLELIASEDGRTKAVRIGWNERYRVQLSDHPPVWYEISGVAKSNKFVVGAGDYSRLAELASPEDLNGKTLFFYGTNPETQDPVVLYETVVGGK